MGKIQNQHVLKLIHCSLECCLLQMMNTMETSAFVRAIPVYRTRAVSNSKRICEMRIENW